MAAIVRNEDGISSITAAIFIRSLANYLSSEALQVVNTDFYLEDADVFDPVYTAVFTSSSNSSSSSAVGPDSAAVYDGVRATSYVYESTGSSSFQVITIAIALTTREQLLLRQLHNSPYRDCHHHSQLFLLLYCSRCDGLICLESSLRMLSSDSVAGLSLKAKK
eukprot:scaffold318_cov332-Ochromonas_danica.AAC.3